MSKLSVFGPSFGVALIALSCCLPAAAQQGQFLVHEASGKCVDVRGGPGTANGAVVQLADCEPRGDPGGNPTDQKWYWENGFLRNALSGKCLDVSGAPGVAPGSRLQLWDCESAGTSGGGAQTDQRWDHANGLLRNRLSANCASPDSNDYRNGTPLILLKCASRSAVGQEFSFRNPGGQGRPAASSAPATSGGKPSMIYPDVPGASQSCLIPVDQGSGRFKIDIGSKLVLANCKPEQGQIFVVSNSRISVAQRPDLCVNVAAARTTGYLYLESCKDTTVKSWEITGNSSRSARIRAGGGLFNNQCWAIPDLTSNKRFPFDAATVNCQGGNRDLKFFVGS